MSSFKLPEYMASKERKHLTVYDSHHFYGLWSKNMLSVADDGVLVYIGHEKDTSEAVHFDTYLSQGSSREHWSQPIYWVENEDALVYFSEEGKLITPGLGMNYHIELTFNAISIKHAEAVTKEISRRYGSKLLSLVVKYQETFIGGTMNKKQAEAHINELYEGHCKYDFEKNELLWPDDESAKETPTHDVSGIEIVEDELFSEKMELGSACPECKTPLESNQHICDNCGWSETNNLTCNNCAADVDMCECES